MRFRMLGGLEVWSAEDWTGISAAKWRSLLACLLLKSGQIVPTESLIFELWGDDPPPTANNLVSIYVHRLRRVIGDAEGRVLVYRSPGYTVKIRPDDTDLQQFESLVADGRAALAGGDPESAAALLAEAEALWRGRFLEDVPPSPLLSTESERTMELRLTAAELRIEADLACGRCAEVIPGLRRLVAEHPLREGLWLLLMRALSGAGRYAEALDVYGRVREVLAEELGVDPGPGLQQLYAELLAADAAPAGPASPAKPAGADRVSRGRPAAGQPEADPARPRSDAGGADEDASSDEVPGTIATGTSGDLAEVAAALSAEPVDLSIPRPAQLPADIGDFTGRGGEVRYLCDMLTRENAASGPGAVRIAVVAGVAGLGKTTLAVHAAHRVRRLFPDGQLYADLAGATAHPAVPGEVLARFLRDLGVEGAKVPVGDEERAALFRTRLTGRRVLILLDNAKDAAQVRPLLPGSASCAVLATTRNRTPDLASTRFVDIDLLADPEALELFSRIVGDDRPAAEPDATAEVLLACAGLPLAIRICAARLAARRQWKVATMANRLRDERRRLDEMRTGDLAVRASFQVSYESLRASRGRTNPALAFRLLGLWQGRSISLPAAAVLIGDPEDDVADALEALVDANLLESPAPDRYRLHDLLRFFATERAEAEESESDRAKAVERLLRWYLLAADAAAQVVSPHRYHIPLENAEDTPPSLSLSSVNDALAWYDSERDNLVTATRQSSSYGMHEVAWQLPTALFSVVNRRANWADCVTLHRTALESVRKAGHRKGEAWVLHNLGVALQWMRDEEGIGHLEHALATRREIGDRAGEAQALLNLSDAYYHLRGPEAALEPYLDALKVLREEGPSYRHGITLNNLGEIYLDLGRLDDAVDCFEKARAILTGVDASNSEAYTLQYLGRAYLDLDRRSDALDCLHRAIGLHKSNGDQRGEALDLKLLGKAQYNVGEVEEARESWTRALAIFKDLGHTADLIEVESALQSLAA